MDNNRKSNKDYVRENICNKLEDLLKLSLDVDEFNDCSKILENDDLGLLDADESFDGSFDICMDPMKMNLYLDIKAPHNSDNEITILDIKSKIEEFGVYCESCVDWEKVREVYTRVMFDGEFLSKNKIAEGKKVQFHIMEHIIIREDLLESKLHLDEEKGSVDFHNVNPFIMVTKNECLGDIIPETPGTDGINLLGETIKAPIQQINYFKLGHNVKSQRGKIYSEINGSFKIIKHHLTVSEVLEIESDIDYNTGNINFKGDVYTSKTVREGFEIVAEGNLIVKESVEPTNINCGHNLTVQDGLIGSKDYSIYVKHDLVAKHSVNANIECLGSMYIANGDINSNICCLGSLNVGIKGAMVGGVYCAQNGIISGSIGNPNGQQSKIYLGTDFVVQKKIIKNQKIVNQMNKLIEMLQVHLRDCKTREERDEIKVMYLKAKSRLNSLNNYSRSLLYRLDKNENSTLTVHGKIKPRTYIEICHISYVVEEEMSGVKFSLDKKNGCIKIEYLI